MWIRSRHDIISRFPWRSDGVAGADVAPAALRQPVYTHLRPTGPGLSCDTRGSAQNKSPLERAPQRLNLFMCWRPTEAAAQAAVLFFLGGGGVTLCDLHDANEHVERL